MVVQLAKGFALMLKVGAIREGLATVLAHKAVRVPRLIHRVGAFSAHWLAARTTVGHGVAVKVVRAVRVAIALEKGTAWEGLVARGAREAIWMPLLAQRSDDAIRDGLVALGAARAEEALVALLAVRLTLVLKEGLRPQILMAIAAAKVLHMPKLSH